MDHPSRPCPDAGKAEPNVGISIRRPQQLPHVGNSPQDEEYRNRRRASADGY